MASSLAYRPLRKQWCFGRGKGKRGTVVEILGQVWLFTVADKSVSLIRG
ncbi:hypothetical protein AWB65_06533 [Caballeronia humi]|uniref:Uncharacterized protein n=1 Tax=Caballeronia humi TaxID=326474 RepID=A0A158JFX5_9BURK|nr:hypothetical protein AWB65_06533 [Caballeronia humi]